MRFWRNFKRRPNGAQIVVACTIGLLVMMALPWVTTINTVSDRQFLGIPLGFLLATLVFPILMLIVTAWFTSLMAEVEPFSEDSENGQ